MAEKFGNFRWVKEGILDNRLAGSVVGRVNFAALGSVEFFLIGDFKGEIAGKAIRFQNRSFVEDDQAAQMLEEFEIPQVGEVSLISFDPHPMLAPHPYMEWFSVRKNHYRIELAPGDAQVLSDEEAAAFDQESQGIRQRLASRAQTTRDRTDSDWV